MDQPANLDELNEEERNLILSVLRRNEELQNDLQDKASQLKQEVHALRMKSVLRSGDDLSKMCARCKAPFGFFFNTGDPCPACRFRVCKDCRENALNRQGWMCSLCFKENQLLWLSKESLAGTGEEGEMEESPSPNTGTPSPSLHGGSERLSEQLSEQPTEPCESQPDTPDSNNEHGHDAEEEVVEVKEREEEEEEYTGGDSAYSTAGSAVTTVHTDHGTCNHADKRCESDDATPELPEGRPAWGAMDSLEDVESIVDPDSEGHRQSAAQSTATTETDGDLVVSQTPDHTNNLEQEEEDDDCETDTTKGSCSASFGSQREGTNSSENEFSDESFQESESPTKENIRSSSPVEEDHQPVGSSEKIVPTLEEQIAEVQKMRNPENLSYTLQRYFQADDTGSDTLSIISERTEPEDTENKTDRECTMCTDNDSDGEGTVLDDMDGVWSDGSDDVVEVGATTPRRQSLAEEDEAELPFLQQQQANGDAAIEPESDSDTLSGSEPAQMIRTDSLSSGNRDDERSDSVQASPLPESFVVEDSPIQTDLALPLQNVEPDHEMRDMSKEDTFDHSVSSEDTSTQTEEVVFLNKEQQVLFRELLKQQGLEKTNLDRRSSEDWTQTGSPHVAKDLTSSDLNYVNTNTVCQVNLDDVTDEVGSLVSHDAAEELEEGKRNVNSLDVCMNHSSRFYPNDSHTNVTVQSPHEIPQHMPDTDEEATVQDGVEVKKADPEHPEDATTVDESILTDEDQPCPLTVDEADNESTADEEKDDKGKTDDQDISEVKDTFASEDLIQHRTDENTSEGEPGGLEREVSPTSDCPQSSSPGLQWAGPEYVVRTSADYASERSETASEYRRSIMETIRDPSVEYIPEADVDLDDLAASAAQSTVSEAPLSNPALPEECAHEAERQRTASSLDQSQPSDWGHVDGDNQLEEVGALTRAQRSNSMGDLLDGDAQLPSKDRAYTKSIDQLNHHHEGTNGTVSKYQKRNKPLSRSRFSLAASRESLVSVYSSAGEVNYGRIPVSGEITFGLAYDQKQSVLRIQLKGCEDLAPVDTKHNRSDPYVKTYLLPDKTRSGKRKSKIKKRTLNPVYDETLSYTISPGELESRTLWVTVWHSDRFGHNDFLGEVNLPMDEELFDDPTPKTYTLQSRASDSQSEGALQYKGELIVSLKYVTAEKALAAKEAASKKSKSKQKKSKTSASAAPLGEVHVMIKSAKHLMAVRSNGSSDPFVKGYLLPERSRTGKQKTPVVKNTLNPMWNHILVFENIDATELADRSLELTVWDHETLGTNEFLGGNRLNLGLGVVKDGQSVEWMDGRQEESAAWQNMMKQPDTWVDAVLPLRASMGIVPGKK